MPVTARYSIVVVGGGPMCTYAMERLAALLPTLRERPVPVRVTVFERTGRFGAGAVHSDVQPATSYMNRIAGQIALGADESNDAASALLTPALRPTFLEWCARKLAETGDAAYALGPSDVPKRHLHGLALREAFDGYVAVLHDAGVEVDLREGEVDDVTCDGGALAVRAGGEEVAADHVLLVTGHSYNDPSPGSAEARLAEHARRASGTRFVPTPYPLDARLTEETVPPGSAVGVLGLGLTAIDVFLHLTEGRGGAFVPRSDGTLDYVASGREPATIVGAGRSGLLVPCRAFNAKRGDRDLEHRAVFLTLAAVERLREVAGRPARLPNGETPRQLDFDLHVLPLVVLEMAYVYYRTLLGDAFAERLRRRVAAAYEAFVGERHDHRRAADELLAEVDAAYAEAGGDPGLRFDWPAVADPVPAALAAGPEPWHELALAFSERDLAASLRGNLRDPLKAACDGVWRDLRAELSAAADRGGLLPGSHRRFVTTYLRHYNRLSNGSGTDAMRKVLALARAGLLDLSVGPDPVAEPAADAFVLRGTRTGAARPVTVVVEGRTHAFDPRHDAAPLYPNLLRRGLVRLWRNPDPGGDDYVPGGLDLTPRFHPFRADGSVERRLTCLGTPSEGVVFFQASAARPHANSYILNTVARWAEEVVADVRSRAAAVDVLT